MKFSSLKNIFILVVLLTLGNIKIFPQVKIDVSEKKVDSLLKVINNYNYGMEETPLSELSLIVKQYLNSSKNDYNLEDKLIDFLKSNSTLDSKRYICEQLSLLGTGKSVPQLLEMVKDTKTSDMARYALERINEVSLDEKLIEMLDKLEPKIKIGIINTLGNRKSEIAANKLGQLVLDNNPEISIVASSALGKIGNSNAASLIFENLSKTNGLNHNVLLDSYLLCADNFLTQSNYSDAANIYSYILNKETSIIPKIAALKGLISADKANRVSILLDNLIIENAQLNQVAAEEVRKLKTTTEFEKIISNYDLFSEKTKIQVLNSIKELNDPFFHEFIMGKAKNGVENLRVTAINCLEKLGKPDDIELLLKLSFEDNTAISSAARSTLDRISGKAIDQKVIELLQSSKPEIQVELIRTIRERILFAAFNDVLRTAKSENQWVRLESYKTLETITLPNQIDKLIQLFLNIEISAELSRMEKVLAKVSLKNENPDERAEEFLTSFEKTNEFEKQMAFLRILGSTGDNRALKYIRTSLNNSNNEIQKNAIKSLYNWPNLEPLDDLIDIVKSSSNNTHQILALRSYLNLVKTNGNNDKSVIELYKTALELATTNDIKIMIISGVSNVQTIEGLNLASTFLNDSNLRPEAELACLNILSRVGWTHRDESLKVLETILENPTSSEIKSEASRIQNNILTK